MSTSGLLTSRRTTGVLCPGLGAAAAVMTTTRIRRAERPLFWPRRLRPEVAAEIRVIERLRKLAITPALRLGRVGRERACEMIVGERNQADRRLKSLGSRLVRDLAHR